MFENGKMKIGKRESKSAVQIGKSIRFSCNSGFYMDGAASLDCLEVCFIKACSNPTLKHIF